MRKVLLISHGEMAKGTLNTMHIFTSDLDNVTAISAYTPECENPKEAVEKFFEEAKDDQVVAFSDIVFGSVDQLLTPYLTRPNTYVFSGFNLPMLLQFTALPEDASIEEFRHIAEEGKNGVFFMNEYDFGSTDEGDE